MILNVLKQELHGLADPQKAATLRGFFKTGPGEYASEDIFLGVVVPQLRKLAKKHSPLEISMLHEFLISPFHEERMLALLLLIGQFQTSPKKQQTSFYRFYLDHLGYVNNWDLVDVSAHPILGGYLMDKNRKPLFQLAQDNNFWKRRCAMVATWHFIRREDFSDTFRIAELLMKDPEPLIHKAVGWMLREIGKRNQALLEKFLKMNAPDMPRIMLRYALERFSPNQRKIYLSQS